MARVCAKMRIATNIEGDILHRMAPLQMLYSMTLTYIFKVTIYKRYYLGNDERWRKNVSCECYSGWYSPPNVITTNVVLCDLELNFQVEKFEMLMSGKNESQSNKVCLLWIFIFAIERHHCRCRVSSLWSLFTRSSVFSLCTCDRKLMSPADFSRLARPPPWRFSCSPSSHDLPLTCPTFCIYQICEYLVSGDKERSHFAIAVKKEVLWELSILYNSYPKGPCSRCRWESSIFRRVHAYDRYIDYRL